ncbi:hypothetical protein JOC73_002923 [Alkaliphilus hydrothermalis]|uniref:Uncharacterized protein n=1 Tax=Alkaliphilus hydrothermalis TaxID=1482730 RepID=A0ABS2NU42_9FIRM|nr:DUF6648 family protein [Alkaliphilus hydrothermalis]MBM7616341.1 hypothetical protein [Alkaliphilus hydrothermalis]
MRYIPRENIFQKFFKARESLIQQFKKGDITKKEYIEEGYFEIQRLDITPFKVVDSFEKAIFNYQYYNTMAKYYYLQANQIKKYGKHMEKYKEFLKKVEDFYYKKDRSTMKAIEVLDYWGVEAYYIQVSSTYLKKKLYEIVFLDHKDVILHSTCQWLLDRLKEEGIFKEGVRKSLIPNYVNQKY